MTVATTPAERLETLVRLAMEAYDATWKRGAWEDIVRARHEEAVRERMAQAAQAWTLEVDADAIRALDESQRQCEALREAHEEMLAQLRAQDLRIKHLNDTVLDAVRDADELLEKLAEVRTHLDDAAPHVGRGGDL